MISAAQYIQTILYGTEASTHGWVFIFSAARK
jgi:hypothetical protein